MKIRQTILIGAGGTGGWLAEPLARLLKYHPSARYRMTLIDGDRWEAKNAARQAVTDAGLAGSNFKVASLGDRLGIAGLAPYQLISQYVDGDAIAQLVVNGRGALDETTLVVFAVDNSATVKSGLDALSKLPINDPWLAVIPGNGEDSGMVSIFGNVLGQRIGDDPRVLYSNYRQPEDRIPGGGCSEQVASTPQLLMANVGAAWGVLCAVTAWLDGKPMSKTWHFNARTGKCAGAGWQDVPNEGRVEAAAAELAAAQRS